MSIPPGLKAPSSCDWIEKARTHAERLWQGWTEGGCGTDGLVSGPAERERSNSASTAQIASWLDPWSVAHCAAASGVTNKVDERRDVWFDQAPALL